MSSSTLNFDISALAAPMPTVTRTPSCAPTIIFPPMRRHLLLSQQDPHTRSLLSYLAYPRHTIPCLHPPSPLPSLSAHTSAYTALFAHFTLALPFAPYMCSFPHLRLYASSLCFTLSFVLQHVLSLGSLKQLVGSQTTTSIVLCFNLNLLDL
ncbi:hypothetical protein BDR07DRAFT_1501874 [Suillus spraguei]|nr:hypothetical protein BDR07DRAFT_1501874 [Suillus spraguei]